MTKNIVNLDLIRRVRYWQNEISEWQQKIIDLEIDTDEISDDFKASVPAGQLGRYTALCRSMAARHKCSVLAFHWALQDFLAENGGNIDFELLL